MDIIAKEVLKDILAKVDKKINIKTRVKTSDVDISAEKGYVYEIKVTKQGFGIMVYGRWSQYKGEKNNIKLNQYIGSINTAITNTNVEQEKTKVADRIAQVLKERII